VYPSREHVYKEPVVKVTGCHVVIGMGRSLENFDDDVEQLQMQDECCGEAVMMLGVQKKLDGQQDDECVDEAKQDQDGELSRSHVISCCPTNADLPAVPELAELQGKGPLNGSGSHSDCEKAWLHAGRPGAFAISLTAPPSLADVDTAATGRQSSTITVSSSTGLTKTISRSATITTADLTTASQFGLSIHDSTTSNTKEEVKKETQTQKRDLFGFDQLTAFGPSSSKVSHYEVKDHSPVLPGGRRGITISRTVTADDIFGAPKVPGAKFNSGSDSTSHLIQYGNCSEGEVASASGRSQILPVHLLTPRRGSKSSIPQTLVPHAHGGSASSPAKMSPDGNSSLTWTFFSASEAEEHAKNISGARAGQVMSQRQISSTSIVGGGASRSSDDVSPTANTSAVAALAGITTGSDPLDLNNKLKAVEEEQRRRSVTQILSRMQPSREIIDGDVNASYAIPGPQMSSHSLSRTDSLQDHAFI